MHLAASSHTDTLMGGGFSPQDVSTVVAHDGESPCSSDMLVTMIMAFTDTPFCAQDAVDYIISRIRVDPGLLFPHVPSANFNPMALDVQVPAALHTHQPFPCPYVHQTL
jgi:hypothetical protein